MRRMEWNQEWDMGDSQLDRQHQAMVGALNRLVDAIGAGRPNPEVKRAISFLMVYVGTHFRREEALMEELDFPEREAHAQQHETCTRRIDELLDQYRQGGADTVGELAEFFKFWLSEHLQGADQRLADFLKDKVAV